MTNFRRVVTKMTRFLIKLDSPSKLLLGVALLVYFVYAGSILFSNDDESFDKGNPNFEALRQEPARKSLFTIPKRKFQLPTTTPTTPQSGSGGSENILKKCAVNVAIILCEDDRYLSIRNKTGRGSGGMGRGSNVGEKSRLSIAKNFMRQINQTLVLLKSIALLTKYNSRNNDSKDCVQVLLLSDKSGHYRIIKSEIERKWEPQFQSTLEVTYIPVRYPAGSSWMRKLFRPCATLRLFLAELLPPEVDSIIYLDTDIIFFQSVQALWKEFNKFDKIAKQRKVAAMAPCLFHYGSSANSIPYFGDSGLNAGIMLMNLTRMRTSQWTNKIRMVTTMFKDKIKLADQDILNIYFHFFPEELHVLSCDWNFRPFQCREGSYCEDPEMSQGISALHGNALSFTPQGPEPLFHSVYQTFLKMPLDKMFNFSRFVDQLERTLLRAEEKAHSDCKKFGGLNVLMLNRYYEIIER